MKKCTLLTACILLVLFACAAVRPAASPASAGKKENFIGVPIYYFSSSTGNDARSSLEAQTPLTPWKTLAKLNAVLSTAQPGTTFLLKRGDVFDGTIRIPVSGTLLTPITFAAYGSGDKPVINGFTSLNTWTNVGGNIWQAPLQAGARLNMLTVGGSVKMRGRWPNQGTANGGYVLYQSHNAFSSITTNNWGGQDWYSSGAYGTEISIRSVRWMLNTYKLQGQSAGTFTYNGDPAVMQREPTDGNGYFIQNDPRTLDQQNEWYYNPASRYVQLYSTVNPAGLNVKAAVADTLVGGKDVSYITFDNISFQGSNQQTICFFQSSNIVISNCTINYAGFDAVQLKVAPNSLFMFNTVDNTNNRAVNITPYCANSVITYNIIDSTGLINGLGGNGNLSNVGLFFHGNNSICLYNWVTNTGYDGIVFTGSNIQVKYNLVDSFCTKFDDGGGIYSSGGGSNRKIVNNLVVHGLGNIEGTSANLSDRLSEGIYIDEASDSVLIDSNYVAYCANMGLSIHDARNVTVTNSTFFANTNRAVSMVQDALQPNFNLRGMVIKNNILFSTSNLPARTGNDNMNYTNSLLALETHKQNFSELTQFGTADNNYYIKPFYLNTNDFYKFSYRPIPTGVSVGPSQDDSNAYRKYLTMDFKRWQTEFGQDAHSTSGLLFSPYSVTSQDANTFTNASFNTDIRYVLNPYSSYVTQSWNNAQLDNGSLQVAYTPPPGGSGSKAMEAWFADLDHTKTLAAGHTFRTKFSIQGNADHNIDFRCAFRSANTPSAESNWLFFKVDSRRQEVELLFTATRDIPQAYLVMVNDNADSCSTWWVDNMVIQEVTVAYTDPAKYLRFEYNGSSLYKPVVLDGVYTDLKNNLYPALVTLAPYSAIILIKKDILSLAQTARTGSSAVLRTTEEAPPTDQKVKFKLSPNPASDHIRLSLTQTGTARQASMTICDAHGSVVRTEQVTLSGQPLHVPIASLRPGVYTIRIVYQGQLFAERFIKL